MMGVLLIAELVLLYVISQRLVQALFDVFFLLFRSRIVGITIVSLFTFPGTVIHELAHLFTAEVLGVRTGKLTLVPENLQSEEIRAGSVMIAQTDPFRRYAIGCAPIFTGLIAISIISYFLISSPLSLVSVALFYLLFAISNSMFSSPDDLKGFVPFALTLTIICAAAYIAGIRIGLTGTVLSIVTETISTLVRNLFVVLGINTAGLFIFSILRRLLR